MSEEITNGKVKPKGPNFLLIVILFCITILVVMGAVLLFLHKDAGKVTPHGANPAPNSYLVLPASAPSGLARG